jgi:hypothetical protein
MEQDQRMQQQGKRKADRGACAAVGKNRLELHVQHQVKTAPLWARHDFLRGVA